MEYRASAALDALLAAHPVNQQGRCASCRPERLLSQRRPRCLIFMTALHWLRQLP